VSTAPEPFTLGTVQHGRLTQAQRRSVEGASCSGRHGDRACRRHRKITGPDRATIRGCISTPRSARCSTAAANKYRISANQVNEMMWSYVDGLLSDVFYEKAQELKAEIEADIERENQRPSSGAP